MHVIIGAGWNGKAIIAVGIRVAVVSLLPVPTVLVRRDCAHRHPNVSQRITATGDRTADGYSFLQIEVDVGGRRVGQGFDHHSAGFIRGIAEHLLQPRGPVGQTDLCIIVAAGQDGHAIITIGICTIAIVRL